MKSYIDKDVLVAEIKNRRDGFYSLSKSCEKGTPAKTYFYAQAQTLEGILSFLDTLEVKEDEALERAKECLKDGTITNTAKSYIETIFPELKESEGEKIRNRSKNIEGSKVMLNACINALRTAGHSHLADWLEKQGILKSIERMNYKQKLRNIKYFYNWLKDKEKNFKSDKESSELIASIKSMYEDVFDIEQES